MKRFWILCICLTMLLACVPTPAVQEDLPQNTADLAQVVSGAPDSFVRSETLTDGIRLEIHADVVKPDAPLSIGTVKRTPFDSETVRRIGTVLWGDAPMYEFYEPKREVASYISACREQMEAAKDDLSASDVANIESTLKGMEAALPNLPDEGTPASYEKIFGYDNGCILVDTGKARMATFQARADYRNIVSFLDLGFQKHLIDDIAPLSVSDEDAIRKAEEILEKLGLAGQFAAVKTGVHTINHTVVDELLESNGYRFAQRHERRYVIFMRKIGDAKQVYSEQVRWGATDGGYNEAVFWEVMEFQFDNDGLVGFSWQEPGNVSITDTGVPVIDFETAYQAMLDYLKSSQNKYTYEAYDLLPERITISIDRIELGMSCVLGKNRTIEIVPVWEFFGEIEYRDANGNMRYVNLMKHRLTDETQNCNSICTIHAITGKRIDRGLGY